MSYFLPQLGNQFASDEREGSVDGLDPFDLALRSKHNFVSEPIHLPSTSKPSTSKPPVLGRAAPSTVATFDTGSVINCSRRLAAKIYDSKIKSILGTTPFEKLTSLRPKLQVIYAEFLKLELDYSLLQTQVENYIQNATNYISMRSNFASRMTSEAKEQRLADVDTKRGQLMEELEQLDLEAKKLKESLEGIDAQRAQKQHFHVYLLQLMYIIIQDASQRFPTRSLFKSSSRLRVDDQMLELCETAGTKTLRASDKKKSVGHKFDDVKQKSEHHPLETQK
ncbi:hypothetical protein RHSIM_Rhsim04G0189600 [Rhododendron simsii]|uniref:Uncharacterized protein n=1 Tax=Rhododendron simsii TaxID=118357 RepID=A0A834LM47_RHOSS|nr:hypothetical protein RHSIM_Rhsim04G0189600 [Rhododendron simsii]